MQQTILIVVVLAVVVVWGTVSGRLERSDLTAPIVFVAVGVGLKLAGAAHTPDLAVTARLLAEITLVLVLFCDASRVRFAELRADAGLYLRLLAVGLPLTMLCGIGLAALLVPRADIWLLVLVGAALAPTDAALGVPVVTSPVVPARIRRALNVESGLNDGVATPVVLAAIAGVAAEEHLSGARGVGAALLSLAVGLLAGLAVGSVGGAIVRTGRRYGWVDEDYGGPTILALALLAYACALVLHGNGFVAAFVGGLAFRNTRGPGAEHETTYVEQSSGALSLVVWLLFGLIIVPVTVEHLGWRTALYAVLSLTVVRMLPVALVLIGSGLGRSTVAFIGWFGPRGLASVVFALLATEELGSGADGAVAVIGLTVLISVVAHGVSAGPLAARYGASVASGPATGLAGFAEPPAAG